MSEIDQLIKLHQCHGGNGLALRTEAPATQLTLTQVKSAPNERENTLTENFLRGRRRDQLSDEDLRVIEDLIAEVRQLPARKTILRAGDKSDYCVLISGGFVDLHAFPLTYLDHDNATITPCTVGIVRHVALRRLFRAGFFLF